MLGVQGDYKNQSYSLFADFFCFHAYGEAQQTHICSLIKGGHPSCFFFLSLTSSWSWMAAVTTSCITQPVSVSHGDAVTINTWRVFFWCHMGGHFSGLY